MIRRPPRSTLFPLHDALPISGPEQTLTDFLAAWSAGDDAGAAALTDDPPAAAEVLAAARTGLQDRKSTRLNSSHANISYAVFCLKKKTNLPIPFISSCSSLIC